MDIQPAQLALLDLPLPTRATCRLFVAGVPAGLPQAVCHPDDRHLLPLHPTITHTCDKRMELSCFCLCLCWAMFGMPVGPLAVSWPCFDCRSRKGQGDRPRRGGRSAALCRPQEPASPPPSTGAPAEPAPPAAVGPPSRPPAAPCCSLPRALPPPAPLASNQARLVSVRRPPGAAGRWCWLTAVRCLAGTAYRPQAVLPAVGCSPLPVRQAAHCSSPLASPGRVMSGSLRLPVGRCSFVFVNCRYGCGCECGKMWFSRFLVRPGLNEPTPGLNEPARPPRLPVRR